MLAFRPSFFLLLLFLMLACAQRREVPEWVYNFKPPGGKTCGVGVANVHIKGFAYQRATAIARAIDEIARQKGVTVNTQLEYFMKGTTTGGTRSELNVYSVQTTEGEVIKARLIETFYDQGSQRFYVLMCEEK